MSYSAYFCASLPPSLDTREVVRFARGFAARWGARQCEVSGWLYDESLQRAAAIVDGSGVSLELHVAGDLQAGGALPAQVLSELLEDGAAAEVRLEVYTSGSATSGYKRGTSLGFTRSAQGVVTWMRLTGVRELPRAALEALVEERMELARNVSALSPGAAFDPTMVGSYEIHIPVLPDSFARLAESPGLGAGCDRVELRTCVLRGHAHTVIRALGAHYYVGCERLEIDVDDDSSFDALIGLIDSDWPEVRWTSGPDEWIHHDGRLYEIKIVPRQDGTGLAVLAYTILDHADRNAVAAWLEARAGVPMAYVESR